MTDDAPKLEPGYYWATNIHPGCGGRQIVEVIAGGEHRPNFVLMLGWDEEADLESFTDFVPVPPEQR